MGISGSRPVNLSCILFTLDMYEKNNEQFPDSSISPDFIIVVVSSTDGQLFYSTFLTFSPSVVYSSVP